MAKFELVVIKPVKGKAGERICGFTTEAKTVTDAVKHVRSLFEGSGYAVMQEAQFHKKSDDTSETEEATTNGEDDVEVRDAPLVA